MISRVPLFVPDNTDQKREFSAFVGPLEAYLVISDGELGHGCSKTGANWAKMSKL